MEVREKREEVKGTEKAEIIITIKKGNGRRDENGE